MRGKREERKEGIGWGDRIGEDEGEREDNFVCLVLRCMYVNIPLSECIVEEIVQSGKKTGKKVLKTRRTKKELTWGVQMLVG